VNNSGREEDEYLLIRWEGRRMKWLVVVRCGCETDEEVYA